MKKSSIILLSAALLSLLMGCASLQDAIYDQDPITDEEVASYAVSRLNNDAMTARATLSVGIQNGIATLYGTVPDDATRERAIQLVRGSPGVIDVRDHTRRR